MTPWLRASAALILSIAALACAGCEGREDRLRAVADAAPAAGRGPTLAALRGGPDGGLGWLGDAALEAADRYREGRETLVFAAAVLDLSRELEREINPNALLLQQSLALLAFRAADDARRRGDLALAREVALGFPSALQTDAYWLRNPEHDGLVSIILFENGERHEALQRIADRAGASEHLAAVEQMLRKAPPTPRK